MEEETTPTALRQATVGVVGHVVVIRTHNKLAIVGGEPGVPKDELSELVRGIYGWGTANLDSFFQRPA